MRTAGSRILIIASQKGPHYSTERNGTESVVALSYGTERNTANMANMML